MDRIQDSQKIGHLAADVMEQIDNELPGDAASVRIGAVAVVTEIDVAFEDGRKANYVWYRTSDPRRWVQAGLFAAAERSVYSDVSPEH